MQKVALILGFIQTAQKLGFAVSRFPNTGIMTGGDAFGSHCHRIVEKGTKLDFSVAKNIWVRSPTGRVFSQKVRKNPFFVFFGEINGFNVDANHICNACGVNEILPRRAVFAVIVILPVLHEKTDNIVALLF